MKQSLWTRNKLKIWNVNRLKNPQLDHFRRNRIIRGHFLIFWFEICIKLTLNAVNHCQQKISWNCLILGNCRNCPVVVHYSTMDCWNLAFGWTSSIGKLLNAFNWTIWTGFHCSKHKPRAKLQVVCLTTVSPFWHNISVNMAACRELCNFVERNVWEVESSDWIIILHQEITLKGFFWPTTRNCICQLILIKSMTMNFIQKSLLPLFSLFRWIKTICLTNV